ncbi:Hypothetical predicted protein [Mytilus galloprovincialis]|uniref:Uncharacterized protein n=1 Tax=Mytilus galloprovincialis TaxID=29158 RepID=A0A8B6CT59_MYTGA|nr:Hypothetical predicted protein [Mytilus galloprovincialis]
MNTKIRTLANNIDNLNSLCENLNFESQDGIDKTVSDFSEFLNGIMSPYFKVRPKVSTSRKKQDRIMPVIEDKPWFNDECKRRSNLYKKFLNVFNHSKCSTHHLNLVTAKRNYKLLEAKLKRNYKKQQGNMLEGLKRHNPKLFYRKFSSKRKVKPKATGKEFFDHFKRIASEINSEENSRNGNSNNDEIPVYEELDCVITNKEILCAISSLKRSKSHGIDGLLNEYFIEFQDMLMPVFSKLFNASVKDSIKSISVFCKSFVKATVELNMCSATTRLMINSNRSIAFILCAALSSLSSLSELRAETTTSNAVRNVYSESARLDRRVSHSVLNFVRRSSCS